MAAGLAHHHLAQVAAANFRELRALIRIERLQGLRLTQSEMATVRSIQVALPRQPLLALLAEQSLMVSLNAQIQANAATPTPIRLSRPIELLPSPVVPVSTPVGTGNEIMVHRGIESWPSGPYGPTTIITF
jgi:hypothetical protein